MNFIKNFNLSKKILFGFINSLLLLIVVGAVAINRLGILNQTVDNLANNLTVDRQIPNDIIANMLEVSYDGSQFVNTGQEGYWQEYVYSLLDVENDLNQAKTYITDPNLTPYIDSIKTDLVTYKETYNQIKTTIDKQNGIKKNILDVQGPLAEEKLFELMSIVYDEKDLSKYHDISQAYDTWVLMRRDVSDYTHYGTVEAADSFAAHNVQFQGFYKLLSLNIKDQNQIIILREVRTAVETYTGGFQSYQEYRIKQTNLKSEQLDGLEKEILSNANALVVGVGRLSDSEAQNANKTVTQALWIEIGVIVVASIASILFGTTITKGITNPLSKVVEASQQIAEVDLPALSDDMNAMAQGDLTRELVVTTQKVDIRSRDEIGQLAQSFNAIISRLQDVGEAFALMAADLRATIMEVSDNATSLSAASTQLAASANQASLATTQIAATVQQVAKGTSLQSESVTRTAASVEKLSQSIEGVAKGAQDQAVSVSKASTITMQMTSTIQQVANNASSVTESSASTTDAANHGSETVQENIKAMQTIKAKVGLSAQKVQEMGKRSEQIGAIVETIEDIASQTNLLALNAAIEAARAGEHGKGFAVVADEVRKLAERASSATKEIGTLIKDIQITVSQAVTAMDESANEVEKGVSLANEAGGALEAITNAAQAVLSEAGQSTKAASQMSGASNELVFAMDSVSNVVEENTFATEEMATSANEVSVAIENIASVSEENSAAIEEVSASAEEMSAQVEEVTASAQSLAEMARALQELVDQFKLEKTQDEEDDETSIEEENTEENSIEEPEKSVYLGPDRRAPMLGHEKSGNGVKNNKMGIQN